MPTKYDIFLLIHIFKTNLPKKKKKKLHCTNKTCVMRLVLYVDLKSSYGSTHMRECLRVMIPYHYLNPSNINYKISKLQWLCSNRVIMLNLMSLFFFFFFFLFLSTLGEWGYWLNKISIFYFLYSTLNFIYYDMLHAFLFFFFFFFLDFSYFIRKVKGKICNKLWIYYKAEYKKWDKKFILRSQI